MDNHQRDIARERLAAIITQHATAPLHARIKELEKIVKEQHTQIITGYELDASVKTDRDSLKAHNEMLSRKAKAFDWLSQHGSIHWPYGNSVSFYSEIMEADTDFKKQPNLLEAIEAATKETK